MHIKNFDPYDFEKKEISGVPVYYKNLPWAPCINIHVVFNTGGFNDPVGKEGLSHFLEHMIFTGSELFKDQKAVDEWSKKYTMHSLNAWTSSNETSYHLKCLPENYKKVLMGLKDIVFSPTLREKDIEHERGVITQEAWRRFKNEKFLTYTREVGGIMHPGHNISRIPFPLGWPETIAIISQADIRAWHTDRYSKNAMTLVLTGAVETKHIEGLAAFIKGLPERSVSQYNKNVLQKPLQLKFVRRSDEIGDPSEQAEISIMRSLPPFSEDKIQLSLFFRYFLGDILFEKLRTEKGLCYGVSVNSSVYPDFSLVFMNIKTDEKNIDIVQKEFWKVLKEIISGKYKNKFDVLKKVSYENMKSKELLSSDVAVDAIKDLVRYGKIIPLANELKDVKKIMYSQVVRFVKEVFDPKWTFTEIILPVKK